MTKERIEKPVFVLIFAFSFCVLCFSSLIITSCSEHDIREYELDEETGINDTASVVTAPVNAGDDTYSRTKYTHGEIRIKMLCAGDNICHEKVADCAQTYAEDGQTFNFAPMYENIKPMLDDVELAYVNEESPMCGETFGYSYYPYYNVTQDFGDTLVDVGFNIINIVNEHILDNGEAGLKAYTEYFEGKDVTLLGAAESDEDYDDIRVLEYEGIKIAFLSYTYGTKLRLEDGSTTVIPYIDKDTMKRQVEIAKSRADLIFVSMHWGEENNFDVTWYENTMASYLTELGVDCIIGTHPHVIQKMEWMTNKEGHKTLVVYSLGNFLNSMYYWFDLLGGIVTFDIVLDNDHEGAYIENVLFTPIMSHYNSKRTDVKLYTLEEYTVNLCKANGAQPYSEFSLEKLYAKVVELIPEEFLSESFKETARKRLVA